MYFEMRMKLTDLFWNHPWSAQYAQILQTLIYLHLSTDCFMKIFISRRLERSFHETAYRQMQIN